MDKEPLDITLRVESLVEILSNALREDFTQEDAKQALALTYFKRAGVSPSNEELQRALRAETRETMVTIVSAIARDAGKPVPRSKISLIKFGED